MAVWRDEIMGARPRHAGLESREIIMDQPETAGAIQELFGREQVVTIHSEEASLEDIFIDITGRGLTE